MFKEQFIIVLASAVFSLVLAKNSTLFTSDNKVECVNKMVNWCEDMKFPKEGTGMSMISIAVTDDSGKFWRIFCSSDSNGTDCTRNRSPWFSCSTDKKLTYDGAELQKDSTDGVDDEICNTTKMAFNDIFIQNLSFNSDNVTADFGKGMEQFFEAMTELQEQLDMIRSRLFNGCFPFCDIDPFGIGFFDEKGSVTEVPESTISNQDNQLERES